MSIKRIIRIIRIIISDILQDIVRYTKEDYDK